MYFAKKKQAENLTTAEPLIAAAEPLTTAKPLSAAESLATQLIDQAPPIKL